MRVLTKDSGDAKMYHMKKATVRDLRYRFSKVEDLLSEGQEILITKRKRTIARLLPAQVATAPKLPDFLSRLKRLYKRTLKVSGADLISSERERF
jgi:antitoxin (DNA-binding transcriptional repressor) of toxin-antitoxin stability system